MIRSFSKALKVFVYPPRFGEEHRIAECDIPFERIGVESSEAFDQAQPVAVAGRVPKSYRNSRFRKTRQQVKNLAGKVGF